MRERKKNLESRPYVSEADDDVRRRQVRRHKIVEAAQRGELTVPALELRLGEFQVKGLRSCLAEIMARPTTVQQAAAYLALERVLLADAADAAVRAAIRPSRRELRAVERAGLAITWLYLSTST